MLGYFSAINKATKVCKAVANGDFEARVTNITEKGKAAEFLHALNRLIDRCDAYVRETRASLEYVEQNKYFRKITTRGMPGAFGEAATRVNNAMDTMEGRVKAFAGVVSNFETSMGDVVGSVTVAAEDLQKSATQMGTATSSASQQTMAVVSAAQQASRNVNAVAAATEEMSVATADISRQASTASEISQKAREEVEKSNTDIKELSIASERIGEVVGLIAEIAEQTNLLALNTSIEAARAGDAGKGFAVVANEVKSLATRTATATKEIGNHITNIQTASDRAVNAMQSIDQTMKNVDDVFATIAVAVGQQSGATQEIVGSIEQASSGTKDVSENIELIGSTVKETDGSANDVLKASKNLSKCGVSLRDEVSEFLQEVRKVV